MTKRKESHDTRKSLLETYQGPILLSAGAGYNKQRAGLDSDTGYASVIPVNIGNYVGEHFHDALVAQAQVNMMARAIVELAMLADTKEAGGVRGLVAGFEIGARKVLDFPHTRHALQPGGMVDAIRGKTDVAIPGIPPGQTN